MSTSPPPFTFSERVGVLLIVESASVSAVTVAGLLLYIAYNSITSRKWSMETHIHYYFLNLLFADLIEALGNILSVKWIHDAKITEGAYCTTQGIVKQTGNVGVALTTLAIAIHTFFVLVFRWRSRPETALIVIVVIWVFIALMVSIGFVTHKHYYGNTMYWCWISNIFRGQQIGLEYLWFWLTAFVSIIIYVFVALVIKGVVIVENNRIRLRKADEQKPTRFTSTQGDQKGANAVAMGMLFYPAVYTMTILPQSIVRWISFMHPHIHIPMGWRACCGVLFASSGVLNVVLYTWTRPKLLPMREPAFSTVTSFGEWQKPTGRQTRQFSQLGSLDERSQRGQIPEISEVVNIAPPPFTVRPFKFPSSTSYLDPLDRA